MGNRLLHIRVRTFVAFGDEAVDPRRDNGQRYRAELEHGIVESADVEFETRSFPNLLVATLATLPSMSLIPAAPFAPSVFSALAENSLFSMRRFVALLELSELLLRAGDVGLVRTAELKELPLPTKV